MRKLIVLMMLVTSTCYAGIKTDELNVTGNVSAGQFRGEGGNVTGVSVTTLGDIVTTAPITINGTTNVDNIIVGADADYTIAIPQGTAAVNGYIKSTDFSNFTNKTDYAFGANYFNGTGNFNTSGWINTTTTMNCNNFTVGNISASGTMRTTTATLPIGYATGSGGTVTQATSRSTGVSINKTCGRITTNATSLPRNTSVSFTVNNSVVSATDVVVISVATPGTLNTTIFSVVNTTAGNFIIRGTNDNHATNDTAASVINFAVIKGASS